jgi:tRNA A37 threonylcarbamoyladenosine dehydratase
MINSRTISLIGQENFQKLANSKIAVFGMGGVGGTCFEALVRSGIKHFYIQDFDTVNESNLNRQVVYNLEWLNEKKCSSAAFFAKSINKNVEIIENFDKLSTDTNLDFLKDYDFVVDAIDDLNAKIYLIKFCVENNINIIVSLGMGRKLDPSRVKIVSLNKTTVDPLAKKLRYLLKKENVDLSKIMCAFSDEEVVDYNGEISSMIFVPSSAGLNMAYFIVKSLITK